MEKLSKPKQPVEQNKKQEPTVNLGTSHRISGPDRNGVFGIIGSVTPESIEKESSQISPSLGGFVDKSTD